MEKVRWAAWRVEADFILHPLIHTLLEFNLAQYIVIVNATLCSRKRPSTNRADVGGGSRQE